MDELIARIAAEQHGIIARGQARAAGMSRSSIAHRLKAGRWHEITPRVYQLAGAPVTKRSAVMATVLSAGGEAVATAGTALALHDVRGFQLLPARAIVARRPHALALEGVTETFWLPESHRTTVDGIPTATVARALFDQGALVGPRRLARSVDAALAAKRVSVPELSVVLEDLAERGRTGSARLRAIVEERLDGHQRPMTELESLFLELVEDHGLPQPECQVALSGRMGWIGDVDFAWRDLRVVVETDGAAFHESITDRENDERRDRALEASGWTILRFNWNDIKKRPTSVVRTLKRALAIAA